MLFLLLLCVCVFVFYIVLCRFMIFCLFFRVFSVGVLVFNLFMPVFYDVGCMPNVLLLLIAVHTCCHI